MLAPVRRGILGGTFDPPHLVHLIAGEAAWRDLRLDVVTFLPAGQPWQKAGRVMTPAGHRWAMTRAAVTRVEYFEADDREVRRPGPTYTIDTLEAFEGDDLFLILGADAALGLPTWHRWREIVDRVHVTVAPRPGVGRIDVEATSVPVTWLDAPEIPLSGTMLRERAAAGKSLRFLVPEAVWQYMVREGLYGQA